MDRRSFLASLIAAPIVKHFVTTEGDDGVGINSNPQIKPPAAVFDFGGLKVLAGTESEFRVNNPFHKCRFTGRLQHVQHTTVDAKKLIAPKAVWDEIYRRYTNVITCRESAPLVIRVGDNKVATVEWAIFQQVGVSYTAQDMCVVENVSLVGRWKELHDAIDAYQKEEHEKHLAACRAKGIDPNTMRPIGENAVEEPDDLFLDYPDLRD